MFRWPTAPAQTACRALVLSVGLAVAGCAATDPAREINDPYEPVNRRIHEGTRAVDRAVIRPVSLAYGTVVPRPLRRGVVNLADTLDTPRYIVNDLLQGRIVDAGHNLTRFAMNLVFGLGILDVAASAGVERRPSDFGETLHRWGVGEGAYLAVPLLGPSTQRDLTGTVVDIAMNPVSRLLPADEASAATTVRALTVADTRYELRGAIDPLLYDSLDSYAQTRSTYLQNRRFELSGGEGDDFAFDPYEDLE